MQLKCDRLTRLTPLRAALYNIWVSDQILNARQQFRGYAALAAVTRQPDGSGDSESPL